MKEIQKLKDELREARHFYKELERPLNKDDYKEYPGLYDIDYKYRIECLEEKTTYLKSINNMIRYYTKLEQYYNELEQYNNTLNTNDYELE
jgi:hypothetical protein